MIYENIYHSCLSRYQFIYNSDSQAKETVKKRWNLYYTKSLFVVLVGNDMYELVLFQLPQMTCAFTWQHFVKQWLNT